MKYAAAVFVCLLVAGCQQLRLPIQEVSEAAAPTPPRGIVREDPALIFFRERLARSGEWIETSEYGTCWYPTEVGPTWRPYTNGRWVYTIGSGWLWIGAERWGWATDHYGRWIFLDSCGWVWVPGKQWAPAWVVSRSGNGYVGWAPMPPTKIGEAEPDVTLVNSKDVDAFSFTFVAEKFLANENLPEHIEPVTRNVTLLEKSEDATRYQVADGRFVNGGVPVESIEQASGSAVPRYHVVEVSTLRPPELRGGEDVLVYRPDVEEAGEAVLSGASVGPPQPSPRPRNPSAEVASSQREELNDRHRALAAQMQQRHARELSETPSGEARVALAQQQNRETAAFEELRQREVEALRRRQLDERARFAARQPKPAPAGSSPDARQAKHYEIPPEWQLPQEYMEPPPRHPRLPQP